MRRLEQLHPAKPSQGEAVFSAGLEGAKSGALVLKTGATRLTIDTERNDDHSLFTARFWGPTPRVSFAEGVIGVGYRLFSHLTIGEIGINPAIPWTIDIRGGASRVEADLTATHLRSLRVANGASRMTLLLPQPDGPVPLSIGGGANRVRIVHPNRTPVWLRMGGGAAGLEFDGQHYGSMKGPVVMTTSDSSRTSNGYIVTVHGGANQLSIVSRRD